MIVCSLGLNLILIITSTEVQVAPTVETIVCKSEDSPTQPQEPSKDSNARVAEVGQNQPKQ